KPGMCFQGKPQQGKIRAEKNQGDKQRKPPFQQRRPLLGFLGRKVENGGNNERHAGQGQGGHHGASRLHIEALGFIPGAPAQNGSSHHQQQVSDNRARERSFHHFHHPFMQSHARDNQFRHIAKGGIEQAANTLS